jgi:serine/threonine-protein kinase RsbW
MTQGPELRLSVQATPENVAVARQAVAGLGEAMGMGAEGVADLKTVVSEAAMNAVQHAYPNGGTGAFEVVGRPGQHELTVTVRDFGSGIRPRPPEGSTLRLGLPLIAAMSDRFEIRGSQGQGTEITIVFDLDRERVRAVVPRGSTNGQPQSAVLSVTFGSHVRPALARVVSLIASRADLSIDRINDVVLLADAISAGGEEDFIGDAVRVEISEQDDSLELRVGPLAPGRARGLLEAMPAGTSLEILADSVEVEEAQDADERAETLCLRLQRKRQSSVQGSQADNSP